MLKTIREKQKIIFKRILIRLSETLQARREWHNILKMMRKKKLQPGKPSRNLSFRFDGEIKNFTDM